MTDKPKRIQMRRTRGWQKPAGAVYVGRPTKWGNPFVVGKDGTRAECVELYKALLAYNISFTSSADPAALIRARTYVQTHLAELRGKDLACWCPLDGGPCHADVLLEIANAD